jgi:DNA-binding transcriptional ArsR family regulator
MSSLGARDVKDAAPLFAALGDETRLALLLRLSTKGAGSIATLSRRARVSRQAITKHLEVLAAVGWVRSERRGRERIWAVEPGRFARAHDYLDRISAQWDEALGRLEALVEAE